MQTDKAPTPAQYISISEGRARVIAGGCPTCADTTLRDAASIFRRQFPKAPWQVYDGDLDRWIAEPLPFIAAVICAEPPA